MQNLHNCRLCKRLSKNFTKLKKIYPEYYNRPIEPSGSINSKICIVGLAPGLHGANRTGRPFFGDFSGDILFEVLKKSNLSIYSTRKNFKPVYITNSIKCYPPGNRPNLDEIKNCLPNLSQELLLLQKLKIIIALGRIAHNAVLKAYSLKLCDYQFTHGKIHKINNVKFLLDSYHCSKININVKKLTEKMLINIFKTAIQIVYEK